MFVHPNPVCIWITGLPAAGKSALAAALKDDFNRQGLASYILDGDELRKCLTRDLGYGPSDRAENVRRIGEVAHLMVDAGIIVIASLISPFRKDRDAVRALFAPDAFIEVFIDTPLEVCEQRDPKGHYKRARTGDLREFTGVTSTYEPPHNPEIHLVHDGASASDQARRLLDHLQGRGTVANVRLK
jgi:adenylyl-sulfate kinase